MSFSSSAVSPKLMLIDNPKTRKDWDNNKLYYQQKFFSKKQKIVLKETERKQEIALKHISTRQPHVSGVDGGMSCSKKAKELNWKYHAEGISIYQKNMTENETSGIVEETTLVKSNNTKSEDQSTLQILSMEVDDWEDLC